MMEEGVSVVWVVYACGGVVAICVDVVSFFAD